MVLNEFVRTREETFGKGANHGPLIGGFADDYQAPLGSLPAAEFNPPLPYLLERVIDGSASPAIGTGRLYVSYPEIQSQKSSNTGHMTLFSEFDKVFESQGDIKVGTSNNIFSNLGYTLPFSGSGVNTYITSLVSKQFIKGFEPTYLQMPFIYSAADNLINGNYKSFEVKDGNKIITTYYIPYQGLNGKEELSTIVTYYDITTNILFYEVPSEFSYNSLTKLSVAASQISEKEYSFKVLIPEDWYSPKNVNNGIPSIEQQIAPYIEQQMASGSRISMLGGMLQLIN